MVNRIGTTLLILGLVVLAITSTSLAFSLNASDPTLTTDDITEEQYSSDIAALDTMREFKSGIETEIYEQGLSGIEIPILIDDYVRNKFYHGYSVKNWHDNWVLYLVNMFIPQSYLSGNMKPDDIIRYDYGICNQQTIVFQELVRSFGFDFGSVRFSVPDFNHFASAVRVNGDWHYFDQNLEPEYDRTSPDTFDKVIRGNQQILTTMYGNHFNDVRSDMIELTEINTFPAARGVLAQDVSYILSWYGWAFFIFPSVTTLLYRRRALQSENAEDRDASLFS